jgi:hypothetical protein
VPALMAETVGVLINSAIGGSSDGGDGGGGSGGSAGGDSGGAGGSPDAGSGSGRSVSSSSDTGGSGGSTGGQWIIGPAVWLIPQRRVVRAGWCLILMPPSVSCAMSSDIRALLTNGGQVRAGPTAPALPHAVEFRMAPGVRSFAIPRQGLSWSRSLPEKPAHPSNKP